MMHKILITAFIAIGVSLSAASYAFSILKADGTRTEAYVDGNKLKLRDATGKLWLPASDGTYKTSDGKTLIVQGGIIAAQSGVLMPSPKPVLALDPSVKVAPQAPGTPAAVSPKTPSSSGETKGWLSPTSPRGSTGKSQDDSSAKGWLSPTSPHSSTDKNQDASSRARATAPAATPNAAR